MRRRIKANAGQKSPSGDFGVVASRRNAGQKSPSGDFCPDEQRGVRRTQPPASNWREMTRRWIWFVPSKIWVTLASRMNRSTGKSFV